MTKEPPGRRARKTDGALFLQIYRVVAQIPPGRVATYGQIAAWLGIARGARTVGWAMWEVPPGMDLPCHRVVSRTGALAPPHVFRGRQRALLEAEGVRFNEDGLVEMERHQLRGLPEILTDVVGAGFGPAIVSGEAESLTERAGSRLEQGNI